MTTCYCPYTDRDIEITLSNSEHIFPLSLGGSNQFVIPVDSDFNCRAGSQIDGALVKDFLISPRRAELNARGHSKREPSFVLKHSKFGDDESPIQVEFRAGKPMQVWDSMRRRT